MPLTEEEKLVKALNVARLYSQQGRWAEAKNGYEDIIKKLRSKTEIVQLDLIGDEAEQDRQRSHKA